MDDRYGKNRSKAVDLQPVLMEWLKKHLPEKDPVGRVTQTGPDFALVWMGSILV